MKRFLKGTPGFQKRNCRGFRVQSLGLKGVKTLNPKTEAQANRNNLNPKPMAFRSRPFKTALNPGTLEEGLGRFRETIAAD